MSKKDYSEDLLIQAPTAGFLEKKLGWTSTFAHDDEDFGADSLLGRESYQDTVLAREVNAALRESPDVSALLQSLYDVVDTALVTDGKASRPVPYLRTFTPRVWVKLRRSITDGIGRFTHSLK